MTRDKPWKKIVTCLNAQQRAELEARARQALIRHGLEESSPSFAMAHEALVWLQRDHQDRRRRLERLANTLEAAADESAKNAPRVMRTAAEELRREALASLMPVNVMAMFATYVRREVSEQDRHERHRSEARVARDTWIRGEAKRLRDRLPGTQTKIASQIAATWNSRLHGPALSPERIREIAFKRPRRR